MLTAMCQNCIPGTVSESYLVPKLTAVLECDPSTIYVGNNFN